MTSTLPWINKHKAITIAVLGDSILDEYLDGLVNRISQEAPVPIHLVSDTKLSAGGAANAALNIHKCGGQVHLLSVCGQDDGGALLHELLRSHGLNPDLIYQDQSRPTIRKTRITSGHHQLLRIDREVIFDINVEIQDIILAQLNHLDFDGLLISDYGKGNLPERLVKSAIQIAKNKNVICCVDPKGADYSRYQNADVLTPNRTEALIALNLDLRSKLPGATLGKMLQEKFNLNDVLVTLGAEGMVFVSRDPHKMPINVKSRAREVYDVSGAGDTVVSLLTLGLAAKSDINEALHIANLGAGLVVEKWGTQPVVREELERELYPLPTSDSLTKSPKIMTLSEFISFKEKHLQNKKLVFTNGCFDVFHFGHADYLSKARNFGDLLVVGVNSDLSIKRLKGDKRPINCSDHRIGVLAALCFVDIIISFDEDTPKSLIEAINPHVLIKGDDYSVEQVVGHDFVIKNGGSVELIPLVKGLSSTQIIAKLNEI